MRALGFRVLVFRKFRHLGFLSSFPLRVTLLARSIRATVKVLRILRIRVSELRVVGIWGLGFRIYLKAHVAKGAYVVLEGQEMNTAARGFTMVLQLLLEV